MVIIFYKQFSFYYKNKIKKIKILIKYFHECEKKQKDK